MPAVHLLIKETWDRRKSRGQYLDLDEYKPISAFDGRDLGRIQAMNEARKLAEEQLKEKGWNEHEIGETKEDDEFRLSIIKEMDDKRVDFVVVRVISGRPKTAK